MSLTSADPQPTRKPTRTLSLTASAITALRPGETIKDSVVPGLQVRARAGSKSFMLYYWTQGAERRPKIGDAAVLPITRAREIARDMLAQVAAGKDPSQDRAAERQGATMDDLWQRCIIDRWNAPKAETRPASETIAWHTIVHIWWRKYIQPKLGKRRVASIEIEDLQEVHASLAHMPTCANHVKKILSTMLTDAEKYKLRPLRSNPSYLVKGYSLKKRKRYAKKNELALIGRALDKYVRDPVHARGAVFLYCMIFSGARPSEIAWSKPQMVEAIEGSDAGVLRIADGKTGERSVFLPVQAMRALATLPPNRKTLTGLRAVPRKLWKRIQDETGLHDLWVRDLRRTFSTVGMSYGGSKDTMGELLGHESAETTEIYAHLMEDKAVEAASAVADHMQRLLSAPA